MAKRRLGIIERTASEQAVLTQQEKHDQLAQLIPMQAPDEMRFVRLKRVPHKIAIGWVLKCQNKLQQARADLAISIHTAYTKDELTQKTALELMEAADEANLVSIGAVWERLNLVMGKAA